MKGSSEQESAGRLHENILERGDELLSQLVTESQNIKDIGKFETDLVNRRNELLFKLGDQVDSAREALRQVEQMEKRLRKHLSQLESLKRVLGG